MEKGISGKCWIQVFPSDPLIPLFALSLQLVTRKLVTRKHATRRQFFTHYSLLTSHFLLLTSNFDSRLLSSDFRLIVPGSKFLPARTLTARGRGFKFLFLSDSPKAFSLIPFFRFLISDLFRNTLTRNTKTILSTHDLTTHYSLPFQPIPFFRLPTSDFRFPTSDLHLPSSGF